MMKTYDNRMEEWKKRIEQALDTSLRSDDSIAYRTLIESMRYSLLAGGKRLRAILVYATADALLGEVFHPASGVRLSRAAHHSTAPANRSLDQLAVAIEMIHTYSLVHDDLPCMDDDDLRRGKPTNHVVFGEATAVLSGDALLNEAYSLLFEICMREGKAGATCGAKVAALAGKDGMIGGQMIDIQSAGKTLSLPELQEMHELKTGALISASLVSSALLCGSAPEVVMSFERLGQLMGRSFQIQDDLLDVTSNSEVLGKTVGKDARDQKVTYVSLLGEAPTRDYLRQLSESIDRQIKTMVDNGLNMAFFSELNQALLVREK